ncbi:uncharacterized protein CFP56_033737 [Quercus suber]|uniref:DUF4283 domain-containing protein n=1 Tax=Quercus suber TaxID=58331 RepID=A0AAW0LRC8_QUESU
MESLEGLWKKLSLLDEEETGIACPKKAEPDTFTLAAKFLTKRVVNMESVARTFRPLWRSEKDVQIKDMGDNILFFNFEDECDLDRVLEHEPWTYDKHLVVFEKVTANVPLSSLAFQFTTFWIQIHELPVQCLNQETRDAIGSSLGKPLLMTDTESEGGKGNYLRVRVRIDITKPLNRVRKVWSDGSVIGCAILKYERLPNFCYWCGLVSHDDRDCERWLRSKGSLKKLDQNFGDWMRAEIDITTRKTSITVPGTRPKHPKSKKPPPQTPTASNIQSPPSQPRDLPPTPATIPTTVTTTAVNEVIIAHQSVVEWQENQALNVPNGCISGTEEAIVEKSSINANIDDKEKVFNSSHSNTETKLDLKPKVLSQHIPTTIGPCTTHQPTITTQSQPHLIPTTIGPCTNHQPTNITQSQTKPLPTKSTWVRIPRDIQSIPNDVLMIERKHKRSDESEEETSIYTC